MKCPNCNTLLDNDANICFACGEEITEEFREESKDSQDKEFDEVIQSLILTDEIEIEEDDLQVRLEQRKKDNRKQQLYRKRYQYMSYATLAVMGLFVISLFLSWFTIRGTVAFQGYFYTEKTAKYLSSEVKAYSKDSLLDQSAEVAAFSPNQFLTYVNEYDENVESHGLLSKLQVYYAKSIYLLYLLIAFCAVVLLLDNKGRFAEMIRISSIIGAIYVLLNTLAMKLPYINLIVLNAKRVLGANGIASRIVGKGLFLFETTKQEITYQADLRFGWIVSLVFVALWFVFATVLMEMSRSVKDKAM